MSCIHGYWAGTEEYRGASRGRLLEGELKPGKCGGGLETSSAGVVASVHFP